MTDLADRSLNIPNTKHAIFSWPVLRTSVLCLGLQVTYGTDVSGHKLFTADQSCYFKFLVVLHALAWAKDTLWARPCLHVCRDDHPGDGGNKHLWNVGNILPDYTALQLRRQKSTYSPPWEPEISLGSESSILSLLKKTRNAVFNSLKQKFV
jgi:hypothetical protein